MAYQIVTVQILLADVDEPGAAEDAVSEALRPLLREFGGKTLVDWRYVPGGDPTPHDGEGFEYL